jgi:hypothetical protein
MGGRSIIAVGFAIAELGVKMAISSWPITKKN